MRTQNCKLCGALAILLLILFAAPATAQPEVEIHQRAFEETDSGLYVRGGGSAVQMKVEERCDPACRDSQECAIACREAPCAPDAPAGARCNHCRWTCLP